MFYASLLHGCSPPSTSPPTRKEVHLTVTIVFAASLVGALLAVALQRERRLRFAMRGLMARFIQHRRKHHEGDSNGDRSGVRTDERDDDWL